MQNCLKTIKFHFQKSLNYYFILILLVGLQACSIHDAKPSKNQFLTIYSDYNLKIDTSLFQIFTKKEGIKVRFIKIHKDSIVRRLINEKFNSKADLLLVSNYELIKKLDKKKLLLPLESEFLENNIDKNYRSKKNTWFALTKTPIVLIYNHKVLKQDTIKNYHELLHKKWKTKISAQDKNDFTSLNFENTIRFLLKEKADTFIVNFNKQTFFKRGNDEDQLKNINQQNGFLALTKLSSLLEFNSKSNQKGQKSKLKFIFPNQRKKGCYISISAGGIYRYAPNAGNAKKLLEFLSSKKAQKIYAKNRFEFPVTIGTQSSDFKTFSRFRGRFYAY
jgi:iron(III) transport system substrate-binding protein